MKTKKSNQLISEHACNSVLLNILNDAGDKFDLDLADNEAVLFDCFGLEGLNTIRDAENGIYQNAHRLRPVLLRLGKKGLTMIEIHLDFAATRCIDCYKIKFGHRMGCSCRKLLSFERVNIIHGFMKRSPEDSKLKIENFISSDDIINHIKHNTAKFFYNDVEVSRENLS